jgi:hypothetical protein
MIDTIEELSDVLKGQEIVSLEIYDDGLHLNIRNGQTLIIAGAVCVGLLEHDVTIQ